MFRNLMYVALFLVTASVPAYPLQAANSTGGAESKGNAGSARMSDARILSNLATLAPHSTNAHLATISNVQILSDLTPEQSRVMQEQVMQRLIVTIHRSWMRSIPEEANPLVSKKGKVAIEFTLHADGTITKMRLAKPSGDVALDRAAWGAITGAKYQSFPPALDVPSVRLSVPFSYNLNETPSENSPAH
jgi:TonB family protein